MKSGDASLFYGTLMLIISMTLSVPRKKFFTPKCGTYQSSPHVNLFYLSPQLPTIQEYFPEEKFFLTVPLRGQ